MADSKFTNLGNLFEYYSKLVTDALKKNLEDHDSIASAQLLQSIQMPVTLFGTRYTMELKMENYWKWVDEGRQPGKQPPAAPLVNWIAHKAIDSVGIISAMRDKKIKSKTRTLNKKPLTPLQASTQLAWIISRKIGKSGTKATHFYSDVINPSFKQQLKQDIIVATKKDIIININKGK